MSPEDMRSRPRARLFVGLLRGEPSPLRHRRDPLPSLRCGRGCGCNSAPNRGEDSRGGGGRTPHWLLLSPASSGNAHAFGPLVSLAICCGDPSCPPVPLPSCTSSGHSFPFLGFLFPHLWNRADPMPPTGVLQVHDVVVCCSVLRSPWWLSLPQASGGACDGGGGWEAGQLSPAGGLRALSLPRC